MKKPLILLCLIVWSVLGVSRNHAKEMTADAARRLRCSPVVKVFQATGDSVVNISSKQIIEYRSPFGIDDLFNQFFNIPSQRRVQRYERTSVGSGFVLHASGYIVTNAHVVARTAQRKVIFPDKKSYDAQVVAIDHEHDLAILKINPTHPLKPLKLGHSKDLMVGETVIAIGNPLGYQNTVTAGVVSATGRSIRISDKASFRNLIQTDASINPGNSGGPLLNILGELVGINTAIRADAQNIGFAIAVDDLRRLLPQMLSLQSRTRVNLGIQISEVGQLHVVSVELDSPAGKQGFQVSDIITGIDGHPVANTVDYTIALLEKQAGDTVTFQIRRQGKRRTLTLHLTAKPKPDGHALFKTLFGLDVETITPEIASQLRMPRLRGLIILKVLPASPAQQVGLRRGDILLSMGRLAIQDLDATAEQLESIPSGEPIRFGILRISGRSYFRTDVILKAR